MTARPKSRPEAQNTPNDEHRRMRYARMLGQIYIKCGATRQSFIALFAFRMGVTFTWAYEKVIIHIVHSGGGQSPLPMMTDTSLSGVSVSDHSDKSPTFLRMKHKTQRWIAIAAALTSAAVALPAPAQATPKAPRPPVRIHAVAYYGTLDIIARETLGLKARFFTLQGQPLAGLPVQFVTTGERFPMCDATTDYAGYAECRNGPVPPPVSLANLLVNGYDATFEGNRSYAPVSAHNNIGIG
jgi:hypothetical protein